MLCPVVFFTGQSTIHPLIWLWSKIRWKKWRDGTFGCMEISLFLMPLTKCGYEPFWSLTLTSLFHQCLVNSPSIHSFHIHDVLWLTDIVFFLQMSTDTLATSGNHCCFSENNIMWQWQESLREFSNNFHLLGLQMCSGSHTQPSRLNSQGSVRSSYVIISSTQL